MLRPTADCRGRIGLDAGDIQDGVLDDTIAYCTDAKFPPSSVEKDEIASMYHSARRAGPTSVTRSCINVASPAALWAPTITELIDYYPPPEGRFLHAFRRQSLPGEIAAGSLASPGLAHNLYLISKAVGNFRAHTKVSTTSCLGLPVREYVQLYPCNWIPYQMSQSPHFQMVWLDPRLVSSHGENGRDVQRVKN